MTFDRADWQRARALFDELVELDGAERIARLDALGADDRVLRQSVERLLAADTDAEDLLRDWSFGSALGRPATVANARDPLGIVGDTVSHFRVKDCLASGGMGVVYGAEDLQLGRVVALKFPLPHQPLDGSVKERFINEARSAGALDHPNLCTVYEVAESVHGLFLVMPLYPGETLKARLARDGTLPADDALAIAQQITTGLASAHAAGIVHRDLKPANVMLLPDGTVKVLDFGLAKIRDVSLTRSRSTLGTIGYVSPEQIRGDQVDARTDLWSIGVMLHEMLTGALPFRGEHEIAIVHGILHSEPSRPSATRPKLSRQLDALVAGLLQKDAGDRYASADELLADIAGLRSGAALAHRSPFWSRSAGRRRVRTVVRLPRRSHAMIPAILIVLAGSAGLQRGTTDATEPPVPITPSYVTASLYRATNGAVQLTAAERQSREDVGRRLPRTTSPTRDPRPTGTERDSIARWLAEARVRAKAMHAFDRDLTALDPRAMQLANGEASLLLTGSTDSLTATMRTVPADWDPDGAATHARFSALWVQRRYTDGLAMLDQSGSELTRNAYTYMPTSLMRAQLLAALGERRLARVSYTQALSLLRDSLAAHPGDQRIRVTLGLVLAGLGERSEAVREAHRAMNLVAANNGAASAPSVMRVAVEVLARAGETDDALDLVELLFSIHARRELTVPYLRAWPGFDPLRNDPRFEALLVRFGADSARRALSSAGR